MDALIRKVNTYGGYDEHWHDGRLYIEYYDKEIYGVAFERGHWTPLGSTTEHEQIYLVSAAAIGNAIDNCTRCGYPVQKVFEFLPEDRSALIPAELFRALMDDMGLRRRAERRRTLFRRISYVASGARVAHGYSAENGIS